MRVLHVMEATVGGTRRHLLDAARGLAHEGVDVHVAVATGRDPGFAADLAALQAEGVGVERVEMVRAPHPRDWRDYRALRRLLLRLRPDVVHTHSSKAGALGRQASLSVKVGARVHTPHTFAFLFEELFGIWKRRLYRAVETRLARRTERLIAVGPSEAETFRASGVVPPERIRVVPNGIDRARFEGVQPADLAQLGLDPARPTAAVIGLLYAGKGQDLALEALARPGCEALQLLLVGPGGRAPLEGLARRLGIGSRVRFAGPRDDVPALLAAIDLLLLPSRWEGMPYVVMEAMASGVPVVATPVDGARDLVDHGRTGWVVPSISAEDLHGGLTAFLALDGAGRAAMGRAGYQRLGAEHTVEHMVRGLLEVYAEVV